MITKFLNDVENKKNKKINSFVEYFEKNIDNVHRKSRKISKFNDIIANENIVAFLTIQKRTNQFQIKNNSRKKIVNKRIKNSRNTDRENNVEKTIAQKKFQNSTKKLSKRIDHFENFAKNCFE